MKRIGLGVLLLLLLAAAAISLLLQGLKSGADNGSVARHVANAQSVAARAQMALSGDPKIFDELARRQRALPKKDALLAALPDEQGGSFGRSWGQFTNALDNVVDGRDAIIAGHDAAATLRQKAASVLSRLDEFETALGDAQSARAMPFLDGIASDIRATVRDGEALASGTGDIAQTVERMQSADQRVTQILRGFAGEETDQGVPPANSGTTALAALQSTFIDFSGALRNATEASSGAQVVHSDAAQLTSSTQTLFSTISRNVSTSGGGGIGRFIPYLLLLLSGLVGFLLMRSSGGSSGNTDRTQLMQATEQNESNEKAILRLLDEMSSLADGDLTVEATVSEDITGAIADSINYAIEALRDLVSTIDGAATEVERLAQQTDASANHLAKSSENQSKQVFAATESIANMAGSIEEVSGNAERSSDVARHSVEVATKGAKAVRRTIDGMNTIRETIQDTSKRIKRLGESSQEIGNIVELINDIAEQTNILALNASIQASMAGEAGRGFAVVADEVQRLSERCTNATKQIEVLVKTIQSDTNEAVVSMERSTTDVVSGALLAENAGESLGEIEKVSNQISSLVQNISGSARQQATAAADITRNMGVLQEISAQTAENTGAASRSIGQLAEMSSQLRRSVDGFTLPREGNVAKSVVDESLIEEVADLPPQETLLANASSK
ncbi:MAG: methyl-accepting chemotaxis protein [Gammaproteobacteria bacterium]